MFVKPFVQANAGKTISEINVQYLKKYLWCIPKTYNIYSAQHKAPQSGPFYDEATGSIYSLFEKPMEISESKSVSALFAYSYKFGLANQIMFVPCVSSMNIMSSKSSVFCRDYTLYPPQESETPFGDCYVSDVADTHICWDKNVFDWMFCHDKFRIVGESVAATGVQYAVPSFDNVKWSSSNTEALAIDGNGKVTVLGSGLSIITAEYNDGLHYYNSSVNL